MNRTTRAAAPLGADRMGFDIGVAASTIRSILNQTGMGRLERGDWAANTRPVVCYQREQPGGLIHVHIENFAGVASKLDAGRRPLLTGSAFR